MPAATLDPAAYLPLVRAALHEDGAFHDVTTSALVPPSLMGSGVLLAKAEGVVAGLPVAAATFHEVDASIEFTPLLEDGSRVTPGTELARLRGPYASLLRAERVALNLLQRMSGIASMAATAVDIVAGTRARVIDTRKTVPGLRPLEKYAVRAGGAHNHRYNLSDGVLIKDNHLAALAARELGVADAVRLARAAAPHTLKVEIEVTDLEMLDEALGAGADVVLLDNMSVEQMQEAVRRTAGRALLEASGGITLATLRAVAETGVDLISLGALTHSVTALDISLELSP